MSINSFRSANQSKNIVFQGTAEQEHAANLVASLIVPPEIRNVKRSVNNQKRLKTLSFNKREQLAASHTSRVNSNCKSAEDPQKRSFGTVNVVPCLRSRLQKRPEVDEIEEEECGSLSTGTESDGTTRDSNFSRPPVKMFKALSIADQTFVDASPGKRAKLSRIVASVQRFTEPTSGSHINIDANPGKRAKLNLDHITTIPEFQRSLYVFKNCTPNPQQRKTSNRTLSARQRYRKKKKNSKESGFVSSQDITQARSKAVLPEFCYTSPKSRILDSRNRKGKSSNPDGTEAECWRNYKLSPVAQEISSINSVKPLRNINGQMSFICHSNNKLSTQREYRDVPALCQRPENPVAQVLSAIGGE